MMGVTDAQGLIAIVDARVSGERPRPEIQPVGKAKADNVRFVRFNNMAKPSHPPQKGRDHEVRQQRL